MAKRKVKTFKKSVGSLDHQNLYMDFINTCREKVYPPETRLQTHHIVPFHDGGTDDKQNLIKLSFEDHVEAHRVRYQVYKQIGDNFFIQMVKGNTEKVFILQRQLGAKATHALLKNQKANRWSSEYQRQLSLLSVKKDNGARSRGGKKAESKRFRCYIFRYYI